jgi:hypothetical protein
MIQAMRNRAGGEMGELGHSLLRVDPRHHRYEPSIENFGRRSVDPELQIYFFNFVLHAVPMM